MKNFEDYFPRVIYLVDFWDVTPTLLHFFAWVSTQFGFTIKAVQCNNGREFDNYTSRFFFLSQLFSCVCLVRIPLPRTARLSG